MKIAKRKMGWLTGPLLRWLAAAPLAQAFYNPHTGRWLSRDPIGERGGLGLHALVNNNPLFSVDPLGHGPYQPPLHPDWGNCDIMNAARAAETRNFGGIAGPNPDPYGGAYRHCVAACLSKRCLGACGNLANRIWDFVNEIIYSDDTSPGDMQGERIGEKVADTKDRCEVGCLKFYPVPSPPPQPPRNPAP